MAYSSGGLIEVTDFNTRVGSVNQLWGTGSGNYGYGQSSTVATNSTGAVVPASDWATLIARMSTMQQHQYNNTSGIPSQPSSGGIITYLSSVDTAITSLQNNRLVTYANGSGPSTVSASVTGNWNTYRQFTFTYTFSSGDAARYFFNAGGYIQLVCSASSINESQWNSFLTSNFYYVNMYANSFYHGGTVGGTNRTIYSSGNGYYNLTTSPSTWLQLYDTGTGSSAYNSNYININVNSNGTQGGNGDAGSVITMTAYIYNADGNSFQLPLSGSTTFYSWYSPPETTYLSNSWGTPSMSNTVATQS
jgi:hypothetical protein